jgi:uncharacterized protein YbaP (TraB family)
LHAARNRSGPASSKSGKPKTTSTKKTASTKKETPSTVNQNTLLWQITGHGLTKPSYIFGTMHLICKEDAALSENLRKAIAESDQVYFEIDLDDMNEMMSGLKYSRMNNYTKLSDLVTPEEYDRIKKYFETHSGNIPFQMLERFKPAMLTSLLGKGACKEDYAMEMSIMDEAKKSNKEIKGLETSEYQAGLLDSIPYKEQANELLNYIDSSAKYEKATQELMEAYKKQDLKKLEALTNEEGGMEKYMDLLLYRRNAHWLQELNLILHSKPTVVAVGAGHLPGDKGMLSLLRKAGYTVKPIPNPPPPALKEKEAS